MGIIGDIAGKVLGGAAGAVMSPIMSAVSAGLSIIDKFVPDKNQAAKLKHELEMSVQNHVAQMDLTALQADIQLALGQIDVNKSEAESNSLFRGGWRPAVGWICAAGFAYEFMVRPLLPWLVNLFMKNPVALLPALDVGTLSTLLMGMLGLGGMRTWEKYKGITTK